MKFVLMSEGKDSLFFRLNGQPMVNSQPKFDRKSTASSEEFQSLIHYLKRDIYI